MGHESIHSEQERTARVEDRYRAVLGLKAKFSQKATMREAFVQEPDYKMFGYIKRDIGQYYFNRLSYATHPENQQDNTERYIPFYNHPGEVDTLKSKFLANSGADSKFLYTMVESMQKETALALLDTLSGQKPLGLYSRNLLVRACGVIYDDNQEVREEFPTCLDGVSVEYFYPSEVHKPQISLIIQPV